MALHNRIGAWGEKVAVDHLVSKGYAITETNWRMNHLEIDIIAMHGDRIVFVEVKSRSNVDDDPIMAVDRTKMRNMARAANCYVQARDIPHEIQFDIIGISGTPDNYRIEHLADAFLPPLKTY